MDKEQIKTRIEELKKQNDEGNEKIARMEQIRNQLVQELLVRNGRILELEDLLKS